MVQVCLESRSWKMRVSCACLTYTSVSCFQLTICNASLWVTDLYVCSFNPNVFFLDVNEHTILKAVPASLYVLGSVALLALSEFLRKT